MNFDTCNGVIHVVKRGDTLYKLSRIYKVKLSDIISANPYINVYNMQPGDEAEERLDNSKFVRISNSEIVNLKKVKSLDLSFVGTICMELSNGTVSYVSRRYVSKIKKVLGL